MANKLKIDQLQQNSNAHRCIHSFSSMIVSICHSCTNPPNQSKIRAIKVRMHAITPHFLFDCAVIDFEIESPTRVSFNVNRISCSRESD